MTVLRLLVNPAAGAGTAGLHADALAEIFREGGFDVQLTRTRSAEHAVSSAADASPDDIVAPLGGDGMLSLAARGLLASGATMLPLPAGRGNDFIRALGFPLDTAAVTRSAAGTALDLAAHTRRIDVAMAKDRPFLGVLSIGFDAETNARANGFTRMRGPLVYTAAGVQTFTTVQRRSYVLTEDSRATTVDAWNLAVGNSGRHGGGQRVCPDASLTDGLLDVVSFGGSRVQFARAALAMRSGGHVGLDTVTSHRTGQVTIDVPDDVPAASGDKTVHPVVAYADGDEIGSLPITVSVLPDALKILTPPPITP